MFRSHSVTVGLFFVTCLTILTNIGCGAAGVSPELPSNPVYATTQELASENSTAQLVQVAAAAPTGSGEGPDASQDTAAAPATEASQTQVVLSAPHTTTSWDERDPDRPKFDLPLLYLHRQREAAASADRTLEISLMGLDGATEVTLEAISRHVDRSSGERHTLVTRLVLPDHPCTSDAPCSVQWTLDAATTLSDFYTLRIKNDAGQILWSNPNPERPDFVALDTWEVEIGAYVVRVYYATLFPFARNELDLDNRLAPPAVTDFVEYVFVPVIVDTWHTQFEEWGFGEPIHPDWDQDKVVEVVVTSPPFALFDGSGPYTVFTDAELNPVPERRIWWPSTANNFQYYDLLPNGYKVTFAHEFFHLAQWNVLLSTDRPTNFWLSSFVEAQGGFAPSVQYPEIEIEERHVVSDISDERVANRFLTQRLNSSYRDLETETVHKYDAGLYWRFLYEQFNDMAVVRAALEEMARHREPDIVTSLPAVMDHALARLEGPFSNFEESLVAFARANYALRLENGRCASADLARCEGRYYDPKAVYVAPALEAELAYDGSTNTYSGAIPTSYGMDFVEIQVDSSIQDPSLAIQFKGVEAVARFNVQVWKLVSGETAPRAAAPAPEMMKQNSDGVYTLVLSQGDATAYDRLALIITRLDPHETADVSGSYQILLTPTE